MNGEYDFGSVLVAAAPVHACLALILALALHRLLIAWGAYRWIWHPVLFDTAIFVVIWALASLWLPPLLHGWNP